MIIEINDVKMHRISTMPIRSLRTSPNTISIVEYTMKLINQSPTSSSMRKNGSLSTRRRALSSSAPDTGRPSLNAFK